MKVNGIPTVCDGTFQSELFAKFDVDGFGTTSMTTDFDGTLRCNVFCIFVDLTALEVNRLASSKFPTTFRPSVEKLL